MFLVKVQSTWKASLNRVSLAQRSYHLHFFCEFELSGFFFMEACACLPSWFPISNSKSTESPVQCFPKSEFDKSSKCTCISSRSDFNSKIIRGPRKVQLKIQYPSKNVNKSLTGSYQSIGKALAHGIPSQIAGAVMNCHSVHKHIVERVLKIANKEVGQLCSTRKPSILRKIEKKDLEKFELQLVCDEWRERAPVFYSFLLTSAINKRTKSFGWFGSLAIAGSILLKQRNKDMSTAASVIRILLKSKSVEVRFALLILNLFYF